MSRHVVQTRFFSTYLSQIDTAVYLCTNQRAFICIDKITRDSVDIFVLLNRSLCLISDNRLETEFRVFFHLTM